MTDQPETSDTAPVPAGVERLEPVTPTDGAATLADRATTLAADRPELPVAAALAGGFLFAQILKRIAR